MKRLTAFLLGICLTAPLLAGAPAEARKATHSWRCSSCKVRVKGHYRKSKSGKSYYVPSYTRKKG